MKLVFQVTCILNPGTSQPLGDLSPNISPFDVYLYNSIERTKQKCHVEILWNFWRCLYSSTNFALALTVKRTDVRLKQTNNNLSSFLKCMKCKRQGFIFLQRSAPGKPTLSTCQLHILIPVMLTNMGVFFCYHVAHSLNIYSWHAYMQIWKKSFCISICPECFGFMFSSGTPWVVAVLLVTFVLTAMSWPLFQL